MFRSFFIFLSRAGWAKQVVMHWGPTRRMSSRFVPGETVEDAIRTIRILNANNIHATLDLLGEHTQTPAEAQQATQEILDVLDVIQATGIHTNVSIKLTQIGLNLDRELCLRNLIHILTHAQQLNNFIRIDMEDSTVTQTTLDILKDARQQGFGNVGIVIQSYLRRSKEDVAFLIQQGIPIRLCKGAYKEPATVAYPHKRDVDTSFDELTELMLQGLPTHGSPLINSDKRFPPLPAIATHDEKRILFAKDVANRLRIPKSSLEFQMLHGIRRDLQESLAKEGYPVRVYVPYGKEWYPYFMRRLGERPANVLFFVSNFFRK